MDWPSRYEEPAEEGKCAFARRPRPKPGPMPPAGSSRRSGADPRRTAGTKSLVRGLVAASRPVRRILFGPRSAVAIHLGRRLPDGSCGLPGVHGTGSPPPAWPCSRWGLPSRPGHPGRWCALTAPFHPYLCAGSGDPTPSAVCSLLRCPAGRPDWVLPSTVPCGVRTFLEPVPPRDGPAHGHPADSLPRTSLRRVAAGPGGRTRTEEPAEHAQRRGDDQVAEQLPGP